MNFRAMMHAQNLTSGPHDVHGNGNRGDKWLSTIPYAASTHPCCCGTVSTPNADAGIPIVVTSAMVQMGVVMGP